jgi:hypothetical protein
MHVGQKVYATKTDVSFHKQYKAKIIQIRPHSKGVCACIGNAMTLGCIMKREYVIEFQDGSRQAVLKKRLQLHI